MLDLRSPAATPNAGRPTIWAVASGKGGVGKSVVASSLAIGLSQTGPRAVVVDLDLGGANLHTLLGCERARNTLADVAAGRVAALSDALADTTVPGVRLLSGARAGLDLATAERAHEQRVLRRLDQIDAGHVVLDLGAGVHPHTLDAFLAADRRLLVVTPEPTAVENAHHFLQSAFFRALRDLSHETATRERIAALLDDARERGATPRELLEAMSRVDARAGDRLRARIREFEIDLVVNRADAELPERRDVRPTADQIAGAARQRLGARVRLAGALADDVSVPASVARGVPVMQLFPGSRFATGVHALVAALFACEPASASRAIALAALPPAPPKIEERASLPERPSAHRSASPGRYLRERREQLGLDLNALNQRTKIRHRHLEAIEAERFADLPEDVILREYVRQVAHALGIADPVQHARVFVEKARATQSPASIAFARALHRTAGAAPVAPPASAEHPSAEALLAGFDYEPEIEGAEPLEV
jgi:flagellar biosynthesis protein FlhG